MPPRTTTTKKMTEEMSISIKHRERPWSTQTGIRRVSPGQNDDDHVLLESASILSLLFSKFPVGCRNQNIISYLSAVGPAFHGKCIHVPKNGTLGVKGRRSHLQISPISTKHHINQEHDMKVVFVKFGSQWASRI